MKNKKEYRKDLRRAKKIVLVSKNPSTSHLQRKMCIGYNYADILMKEISKGSGFKFVLVYLKRLSTKR
ncbi:MAG: hypothetical protein KAI79_05080 [Bacteroidales bacterium]|nr:hypothetical protein [Bacteroidales bacterium]